MRIEFEVDITPVRAQRPKLSRPDSDPATRVGGVVRYLVLAWQVEQAITQGRARDYGEAAVQLGMSRARLSQIMGMRFLSPRIQEVLLCQPQRARRISERRLRKVTNVLDWDRQWEMFEAMLATDEDSNPPCATEPGRIHGSRTCETDGSSVPESTATSCLTEPGEPDAEMPHTATINRFA